VPAKEAVKGGHYSAIVQTPKAVNGGAYSAVVYSSVIGLEGGQILVDRTVDLMNSLWPE
jgi:hypothetical protein